MHFKSWWQGSSKSSLSVEETDTETEAEKRLAAVPMALAPDGPHGGGSSQPGPL